MTTLRFPVSPREQVGGLVYVARMFDKIRLHAAGALDEAYHAQLGQGFDGEVCTLLGLSYEAIRARVLEGGSDEEILDWAFQEGFQPSAAQAHVWNAYMSKWGWRDEGAPRLLARKAASGLADREEIQCFFDYLDADEGRA